MVAPVEPGSAQVVRGGVERGAPRVSSPSGVDRPTAPSGRQSGASAARPTLRRCIMNDRIIYVRATARLGGTAWPRIDDGTLLELTSPLLLRRGARAVRRVARGAGGRGARPPRHQRRRQVDGPPRAGRARACPPAGTVPFARPRRHRLPAESPVPTGVALVMGGKAVFADLTVAGEPRARRLHRRATARRRGSTASWTGSPSSPSAARQPRPAPSPAASSSSSRRQGAARRPRAALHRRALARPAPPSSSTCCHRPLHSQRRRASPACSSSSRSTSPPSCAAARCSSRRVGCGSRATRRELLERGDLARAVFLGGGSGTR